MLYNILVGGSAIFPYARSEIICNIWIFIGMAVVMLSNQRGVYVLIRISVASNARKSADGDATQRPTFPSDWIITTTSQSPDIPLTERSPPCQGYLDSWWWSHRDVAYHVAASRDSWDHVELLDDDSFAWMLGCDSDVWVVHCSHSPAVVIYPNGKYLQGEGERWFIKIVFI